MTTPRPAGRDCERLADAVLGPDGVPADPIVVLDTGRPPPDPDRLGPLLADPGRVVAGAGGAVHPGWGRLLGGLDVVLVAHGTEERPQTVAVDDPAAAAAELVGAVTRQPVAALVLRSVLRAVAGLGVPAGLDVESLAYSTLLGGPAFREWLAARPYRAPEPDPADPVLSVRDGDTLLVTLNRPHRRNAYSAALRDALVAALDTALWDTSVARVVLQGAGPVFCAGGDLDEFGTASDPATAHLVRSRGGAARPVHALAGRTEVRLHGTCVGAGIEIPSFAGRVVAAPDTVLRLPELSMGLIPGAGGTVGISRRIGRWRTFHLAATGRALGVATALRWGLVDAVDGPH